MAADLLTQSAPFFHVLEEPSFTKLVLDNRP